MNPPPGIYPIPTIKPKPYKPASQSPAPGTTAPAPIAPVQPPKNPYDTGDSVLQQILGQNQNLLGQAAAQKTADQRKLLLGFGSSELAKSLFGNDQSFVDAVAGNPFSVLGQIKNQYEGRGGLVNQANERLNQGNLFFSSERTQNVLPGLATQRSGQEYDATQQVQDALEQVSRAYTGTQNQAVQTEIQARQDAADRATQAALASGYGPGANPTVGSVSSPINDLYGRSLGKGFEGY